MTDDRLTPAERDEQLARLREAFPEAQGWVINGPMYGHATYERDEPKVWIVWTFLALGRSSIRVEGLGDTSTASVDALLAAWDVATEVGAWRSQVKSVLRRVEDTQVALAASQARVRELREALNALAEGVATNEPHILDGTYHDACATLSVPDDLAALRAWTEKCVDAGVHEANNAMGGMTYLDRAAIVARLLGEGEKP